jgi:hypothetical protein
MRPFALLMVLFILLGTGSACRGCRKASSPPGGLAGSVETPVVLAPLEEEPIATDELGCPLPVVGLEKLSEWYDTPVNELLRMRMVTRNLGAPSARGAVLEYGGFHFIRMETKFFEGPDGYHPLKEIVREMCRQKVVTDAHLMLRVRESLDGVEVKDFLDLVDVIMLPVAVATKVEAPLTAGTMPKGKYFVTKIEDIGEQAFVLDAFKKVRQEQKVTGPLWIRIVFADWKTSTLKEPVLELIAPVGE